MTQVFELPGTIKPGYLPILISFSKKQLPQTSFHKNKGAYPDTYLTQSSKLRVPLSTIMSPDIAQRLEYYEGWITQDCSLLLRQIDNLETLTPLLHLELADSLFVTIPHVKILT